MTSAPLKPHGCERKLAMDSGGSKRLAGSDGICAGKVLEPEGTGGMGERGQEHTPGQLLLGRRRNSRRYKPEGLEPEDGRVAFLLCKDLRPHCSSIVYQASIQKFSLAGIRRLDPPRKLPVIFFGR